MTVFGDQRKILERAVALGWTGEVPSVLGNYFADKAVREAEQYIAAHATRGVYGEWCHDPTLCAGSSYCPRDPTCAD